MALIQVDNDGVITTRLHWDEQDGATHVERVQDVEWLLERNKALAGQRWDGYSAERDMKAIAEIPIAIAEQWAREGVTIGDPNHDAEVMKRLRDPALAGFRMDTAVAHSGIIIKGDK